MTNFKTQLRALFDQAVADWIAQGRDEEHVYAVRNFLTGRGGEPLVDAILALIDETIEEVVPPAPMESVTTTFIKDELRQAFGLNKEPVKPMPPAIASYYEPKPLFCRLGLHFPHDQHRVYKFKFCYRCLNGYRWDLTDPKPTNQKAEEK